jgi:hypothetical protein
MMVAGFTTGDARPDKGEEQWRSLLIVRSAPNCGESNPQIEADRITTR